MASPIQPPVNSHKIRNTKSTPALNKIRANLLASEVPALKDARSGTSSPGVASGRASSVGASAKGFTVRESAITSLGETSSVKESGGPFVRGKASVGKTKSKVGFFRKLSLEWNLFLLRLRSISDEVFLTDEIVENLFEEEDQDFDSLARSKVYKSAEENFIASYRHFKNLNKMVQHFQSSNDVRSSSTVDSKFTVQDIIRQSESECVAYNDLDVCKMRQEFESSSTDSTTINSASYTNIGTALWEYRRKRWLRELDPTRKRDLARTSIEHIPKDSYVKIYTNLVDKGRSLKEDKRLNLGDLVKIIDAGWVAEEKWERAAKGLA